MERQDEMDVSARMGQGMAGTARAVQKEVAGTGGERPTGGTVDRATVDAITGAWSAIPQGV